MCVKNKKIILVAFKFPPYAGVGARRWAKFSKYLAEDGYEVHVLTVKWHSSGPDTWIQDIANPKIIIHEIPSFGFHNMRYWRFPQSLAGKAISKTKTLFFKALYPLYKVDEAQFWGISLIPFAESLIKRENIVNVIATGAPFMANYWAAKLKKRQPHINLIQDFRDPWTQDPAVPRSHKSSVKKIEQFAKGISDKNVYVTFELMMLMGGQNQLGKNIVVHNGFDSDIIDRTRKQRDFVFLYAGSTGVGREEPLEQLLSVLARKETKWPELRVIFVGSSISYSLRMKYRMLFSKRSITFLSYEDPERIKERIDHAFACLQFTARMYPYGLSSKLFDYAVLKRPILSINYGGEIDRFIREYNLGYSVFGDEHQAIEKAIDDLYSLWKRDPEYEMEGIHNIEGFHCKNLVKKIEDILV